MMENETLPIESTPKKVENGFLTATVEPLEESSEKGLSFAAWASEGYLKIASRYLEKPENDGFLPKPYSEITDETFHKIVTEKTPPNPNFDKLSEARSLAQNEKDKSNKSEIPNSKFEEQRLKDLISQMEDHKEQIGIVTSLENYKNPFGHIPEATLIFTADQHHAPTDAKAGTRTYSFKRYLPERLLNNITKILPHKKSFGDAKIHTTENDQSELLSGDYIKRELVRSTFHEWLLDVASQGGEHGIDDPKKVVMVSLGDVIHDGGFFIDQIDAENKNLAMLDELQSRNPKFVKNGKREDLRPSLIELNGNHDQDSRVPESIPMLTEMFGHRIFTQEIGGTLLASVDTNIMVDEWVAILKEKGGEKANEIIQARKEIQNQILEDIKNHDGPVVLMGHNPSKLILELAIESDVIQNSNVVSIIGGHTHTEAHKTPPFKNKSGKEISVHVLESVVRYDKDRPIPPKAYMQHFSPDGTGEMWTIKENNERFQSRFNTLSEYS